MKILLVNKYHYHKGGAETYYFSLADGLKKQGHDVIYFSMNHPDNLDCDQKNFFVTNREYNQKSSLFKKISALNNIIYSKESYRKIGQLLDVEKPDLVILNNIHRQLTTSIVDAINERGITTFWVMHDLMALCPNYTMLNSNKDICEKCASGKYDYCIKYKCIKNSFLKSVIAVKEAKYNSKKNIYNKVDMLITPSDFYRNKLIEYGFDKDRVITLRNPLSYDTHYEINNENDDYVLYFGRLSKEKGVINLINAIKDIDYKLIIAGTGPLENELKEYVKVNNICNVEFVGFLQGDDLLNLIRRSRCVVLPSQWYENGPYSAMEAMALGKPLIVSNRGGLPELVRSDVNGFVYESQSDLKEKLVDIINCPRKIYNNFCENSYRRSIELFSIDKYITRLLKLYED